jgi:hypothetical protein
MSITSMHGCQNMIKESRTRPGSDWPRSAENFRSPVTEKGENDVVMGSGGIRRSCWGYTIAKCY